MKAGDIGNDVGDKFFPLWTKLQPEENEEESNAAATVNQCIQLINLAGFPQDVKVDSAVASSDPVSVPQLRFEDKTEQRLAELEKTTRHLTAIIELASLYAECTRLESALYASAKSATNPLERLSLCTTQRLIYVDQTLRRMQVLPANAAVEYSCVRLLLVLCNQSVEATLDITMGEANLIAALQAGAVGFSGGVTSFVAGSCPVDALVAARVPKMFAHVLLRLGDPTTGLSRVVQAYIMQQRALPTPANARRDESAQTIEFAGLDHQYGAIESLISKMQADSLSEMTSRKLMALEDSTDVEGRRKVQDAAKKDAAAAVAPLRRAAKMWLQCAVFPEFCAAALEDGYDPRVGPLLRSETLARNVCAQATDALQSETILFEEPQEVAVMLEEYDTVLSCGLRPLRSKVKHAPLTLDTIAAACGHPDLSRRQSDVVTRLTLQLRAAAERHGGSKARRVHVGRKELVEAFLSDVVTDEHAVKAIANFKNDVDPLRKQYKKGCSKHIAECVRIGRAAAELKKRIEAHPYVKAAVKGKEGGAASC